MAVIVKYIVVRNGEEKMTFATKKEADAHDKMLDIADNVFDFLQGEDLKLNENQCESIAMVLTQNRDILIPMLKGSTIRKKSPGKTKHTSSDKANAPDKPKTTTSKTSPKNNT